MSAAQVNSGAVGVPGLAAGADVNPTPDVVALQAAIKHVIIREGSKLTEWYEPDAMETILRKGCPMNHDAEAADAAYIAACHPDRITRVLAALRAAEQRAEAAEADAARYRWLRNRAIWAAASMADGTSAWCVVGTGCTDCHPCEREELDAAIDAALKQGEQGS